MRNSSLEHIVNSIRYSGFPLLVSVHPAVFHYANNARLVRFSSLLEICVFLAGISMAVYLVLGVLTRGKLAQSAIGAGMMLGFFHIYGLVFDMLHSLDILQMEMYNFLPFYIFMALYVVWQVVRINSKRATQIWSVTGLILAALVLFNVLKAVSIQVKMDSASDNLNISSRSDSPSSDKQYPDIYYLVFDEAAGFEVVRRYWHYEGVDTFVNYLMDEGFYVAELSHSGSTHTLREIATRLNYEVFPVGNEYFTMYNDVISSNKVMGYLREQGYTLVAFDERRTAYPTAKPMPVDILIEKSPEQAGSGNVSVMDDFKFLVLHNTLLRSFIDVEPETRFHLNMILHTTDSIASEQFSPPKFVYVHLMLPHVPFAFTENGGVMTVQTEYFNWQRYLDNYKFSIQVMHEMAENILASSRPGNPPVIILQSDHGARNQGIRPYSGNLKKLLG